MAEHRYKSLKSHSSFIVSGDNRKAYVIAEGVAAMNTEVRKRCEEVRQKGYDFSTADWIARQLSRDY